jgi:arabinofuranosyltransferase
MRSLRPRWPWLAAALVLVLLIAGWNAFWFLTDDAFIEFRYAANAAAGRGYTWNPPPFHPVEGYTSFLWIVLLEGVWRVLGPEPPRVANTLSLVCSAVTLGMTGLLGLRMALPDRARGVRGLLVLVALLGTVTNPTFLTWTSSGLETALFNMLLTLWVYAALFMVPGARRWCLLASAAAASALTRPDGMLLVAGTLLLLGFDRSTARFGVPQLVASLALAVVPAHVLWRRATYGAWLPNTYYAKYVAPWPQSGWRYALSFLLEYGFWTILALAAVYVVRERAWRTRAWPRRALLIVWAVLAAHGAFYTLVIGGDHFEYRVYSHLIPFAFLAAAWLSARLFASGRAAVAALIAVMVLSWPIPWAHWMLSRSLSTRAATRKMVIPLAPHTPWPARGYVAAWDALQGWLIPRFVCIRHREHEIFWRELRDRLPDRAAGSRVGWEGRPVAAADSVGIIGWVYPNVAIIDLFGLNDVVIAHSPAWQTETREMAHERHPPAGYVECFRPNFDALGFRLEPRPLDDRDIVACEDIWWARVGR